MVAPAYDLSSTIRPLLSTNFATIGHSIVIIPTFAKVGKWENPTGLFLYLKMQLCLCLLRLTVAHMTILKSFSEAFRAKSQILLRLVAKISPFAQHGRDIRRRCALRSIIQ